MPDVHTESKIKCENNKAQLNTYTSTHRSILTNKYKISTYIFIYIQIICLFPNGKKPTYKSRTRCAHEVDLSVSISLWLVVLSKEAFGRRGGSVFQQL